MKLDTLHGQARKFAVACIDMNTMDELMIFSVLDQTDCETWGITEDEWCRAIDAAIEWKLLQELHTGGQL